MSTEDTDENLALSESSEPEFDDVIINQTNIRIQEELNNLSADELKASVIVAIVPAIFGILSALTLDTFVSIFKNPNWYDVFLLIPFGLLIFAFVLAAKVIFPRTRFELWDPRDSNNEYSILKIADVKKTLKKERIEDFESIKGSRDKDAKNLKIGYVFLILGAVLMLIFLTFLSSGN